MSAWVSASIHQGGERTHEEELVGTVADWARSGEDHAAKRSETRWIGEVASSLKEESESSPSPGDVATPRSIGPDVGNVHLRKSVSFSLSIAKGRLSAPKLARQCESLCRSHLACTRFEGFRRRTGRNDDESSTPAMKDVPAKTQLVSKRRQPDFGGENVQALIREPSKL